MIIEKIILQNYRPYINQEILFAYGNKNFTTLTGENGTGKTYILNALTWCFYGNELHLTDEEEEERLPLLNTKIANNLEEGEEAEVKVTIHMKSDEGEKINFIRSLPFIKMGENLMTTPRHDANSVNGTNFEITKQDGRDMVPDKTPNTFMGSFIPQTIEEYFFFDGERLKDYIKKNSGKKIKDAVFKISQLESLMDVIDNLDKKKIEYRRELSKLNPQANKIKEELELLEQNIIENREKRTLLLSDKEEAIIKVKEYSQKVKEGAIKEIEILEDENTILERDLEKLKNDIDENEQKRFDYLIKMSPRILSYDSIKFNLNLLEETDESDGLPSDIRKRFVKKLMDNHKCICGSDLNKDTEYRKNIEIFYEKTEDITDITDELITEMNNLTSIQDSLKDFRETQIDYGKKNRKLEEEIEEKNNKLTENNSRINTSDRENVRKNNEKKLEWKKIKEDAHDQLIGLGIRISDAENERSTLETKWRKEIDKEDKEAELKKLFEFCDKGRSAAIDIRDEIMVNILKEIEEKTKNQFIQLSWKGNLYSDVQISEDYKLTVKDQYGNLSKGTLSSGESELLALSFTAALNTVSGFNVPIIIDSPLMRLDAKHRLSFAENLPKFLEGKQIILLLIDEEYTPKVRSILSNKVGKEYLVKLKDANILKESMVIPYE